MTERTKIDEMLNELAETIIEKVSGDDIAVETQVDAFKAVATYSIAVRKLKDKPPEEPEDGMSFGKTRARLESIK